MNTLLFIEELVVAFPECDIQNFKTSSNLYFTHKNCKYLLNFTDLKINYLIKEESGVYKHEVEVLYDKNLEFIGTKDNSLLPKDINRCGLTITEFCNCLI